MQDGKGDHWAATAGFMTVAAIVILEGLAVYRLNIGSMRFQAPMTEWSDATMRTLFGTTR